MVYMRQFEIFLTLNKNKEEIVSSSHINFYRLPNLGIQLLSFKIYYKLKNKNNKITNVGRMLFKWKIWTYKKHDFRKTTNNE